MVTAAQLARIYAQAEGAVRAELGVPPPEHAVLEPWFAQMLAQRENTFFVEDGAGFIQLAAPRTLAAMYVVPARWGSGVATVLHDRGLAHLRALGATRANLIVITRNARARRFYERHGWQLAGDDEPREFGETLVDFVRYERAI